MIFNALYQRSFSSDKARNKRASAMILTMFIMSGMMLVAMSGAYVVLLGIRAGGLQAQSGKAYFAAEAGAEHILWELRKNGTIYPTSTISDQDPVLSGSLSSGYYTANYEVYFVEWPPYVFQAVGDHQSARRSVEVRIGE